MEEKTTKELNLVDILAAIWGWIIRGVKYIIAFLGSVLQLLYRQKILTLCILVVAFAVSQYLARPSNRRYHVEGMATLYGVQAQTVIQVGNQLAKSSPRFEETSLSRKLELPDSITQKLAGVEFFRVIDYQKDSIPDVVDFSRNHSLSDTTNVLMNNYLYMRLTTIGTKYSNEIGEAVLKYINDNPKIKKDYITTRKSLEEEIFIANAEISRIDSLAKKKYFEESKTNVRFDNNQLLVGNHYTQLFYGDMFRVQDIKAKAERKLENASSPVVVASGLIVDPNPENGRMKNGAKGLLIGLLLSVAMSFIVENLKTWIRFLSNKY